MTTWNIEATRGHVTRLFGREQCERVRPCLQSVVERQNYARYHYQEASDLFLEFARERLAGASLIEVVFSSDDDTRSDFQELITKVGANVLACVQSMHAVADILAHAVYYALGLNLTKDGLSESAITANAVIDRTTAAPDYREVGSFLSTLVHGGQFAHVAALANHGKHRSIIRPSVSEDMTGEAPVRHTLKFAEFMYKKHKYPEVDARTFIQQEYDRASVLVVDTGNALNAVLQAKAP